MHTNPLRKHWENYWFIIFEEISIQSSADNWGNWTETSEATSDKEYRIGSVQTERQFFVKMTRVGGMWFPEQPHITKDVQFSIKNHETWNETLKYIAYAGEINRNCP